MGMRGHLRQLTPDEMARLQRNPKAVKKLIEGKVRSKAAETKAAMERAQQIKATAVAAGNLSDPAEQERVRALILKELAGAGITLQAGPTEDGLNLEKSWHVLHYLLTGEAEEAPPPLGNAILGGEEIGEDLGYGPARFLTPQQVRDVATGLAAISKDDLRSRFHLDAMIEAHIYPCKSNNEGEVELAQDYFDHLSRYYADAAASGNAMLLWVV
jgi:hypothetical protein